MPLEHHPLNREFPDFQDSMRTLLQKDAHFARLAGEYQQLDSRIYEVEDGNQALDDTALNGLKMQRVALKDEIAKILKDAQS
ncbi:YdcH family protein [Metapseudomonas boanensis]|uniref:YdcH family protein n=1 Tax=Metapseudomonas boanensis TaxID=2822138 RepID=A0ABS5XMV3_9GAMM|nr:YdcH family protein [Pseudomonas boanensis]MBT8769036.1 YdcH family protein [Pseudomonas boanensis]